MTVLATLLILFLKRYTHPKPAWILGGSNLTIPSIPLLNIEINTTIVSTILAVATVLSTAPVYSFLVWNVWTVWTVWTSLI